MSRLLVHTVDGEIVGNKIGPQWSLEQYASDSEELCLIVEDGQNCEFHYVDDGALVEKPEQPSPEHTFDYATKQWVYDLTGHRNEKLTEIKAFRDTEEFSPFVWNNHTFVQQFDPVDKNRHYNTYTFAWMVVVSWDGDQIPIHISISSIQEIIT